MDYREPAIGPELIHPTSLMGLSWVLRQGYPKMTADQAVSNAHQIIRALHQMGLEIGPLGSFGPQAMDKSPLDALDLAADMIEAQSGRKPWLPDGS